MPTTTVTITNTTSAAGTVTIRQGELSGRPGRSVILEATPANGYVFDKWEIETTPVQLQEFARVGTRYSSIDEVCSAEQVDLTTPLYTDGTQLYTDSEGKYAAAEGVYQSNRGTYYNYRGSGIPPLQVCQAPTTIQPQTGGGGRIIDTGVNAGSFTVDGFGGATSGGGFNQVVSIDQGINAI